MRKGKSAIGRLLVVAIFGLAVGCATSSGSKGNLQVSDSWITTRAENEVKELGSTGQTVRVKSVDGVIYLEGQVKSIAEAEKLEEKVSSIRGVREVRNNLVVRP